MEGCYKRLLNATGRSISISATGMKMRALYIAKELGCNYDKSKEKKQGVCLLSSLVTSTNFVEKIV